MELSHLDLTDNISFGELHATASALREIANKEQKTFIGTAWSTGRTTTGNQFIFLHMWIHNQQQSSFRWVFKLVLKIFIPTAFHNKVELVLVYGDKQQQVELFHAVQSYFTNAKVGICMFHIV